MNRNLCRKILVFAVLGFFAGIGFVVFELAKSHHAVHAEKSVGRLKEESMKNLRRYIKTTLGEGYKEPDIRKGLINEGWPKEIVDKAFGKKR